MEEKIAFESKKEYKGFKIKALWDDGNNQGNALVVITRNGEEYKKFTYPAYKVFNLAAHFEDIVDGEIKKSDIGYQIAGQTGFGGVVMPQEVD